MSERQDQTDTDHCGLLSKLYRKIEGEKKHRASKIEYGNMVNDSESKLNKFF
jgi:hypothetical protein